MGKVSRRSVLKFFGAAPALFAGTGAITGLSSKAKAAGFDDPETTSAPQERGYLSIIQGPTSDSETLINVFAPRLKKYYYEVSTPNGQKYDANRYATVTGPLFYNIDKVRVSGLTPGVEYTLKVLDGKSVVDERTFKTIDTRKTDPTFAFATCMADDNRFNQVIDPMWARMEKEDVDFVILGGDLVYVDSFEFVEREKATEIDIWQRYVDSLKRIPIYHWRRMKPIFALWDDHDFGTNDGDRVFQAKQASDRIFHAAFSGPTLSGGAWTQTSFGTASSFEAFGQRFFFMDDRSFRQPNKNQKTAEDYGHWGQEQHQWLMQALRQNGQPAWIFNGNQFFDGTSLSYKEAFELNHPKEFRTLLSELSELRGPVVFASGDVHLSEVMRVPRDRMGYETFEFTSSSMHSYTGDGWENPMRVPGAYTKEFNFMVIRSRSVSGDLQVDLKCVGLPQTPYFQKSFTISR